MSTSTLVDTEIADRVKVHFLPLPPNEPSLVDRWFVGSLGRFTHVLTEIDGTVFDFRRKGLLVYQPDQIRRATQRSEWETLEFHTYPVARCLDVGPFTRFTNNCVTLARRLMLLPGRWHSPGNLWRQVHAIHADWGLSHCTCLVCRSRQVAG